MTRKYARDGYCFYSVSTPSFFLEYELPVDFELHTCDQELKMERLEQEAGNYRVYVHASEYELG
jgi:hypothetical protein